MIKKKNKPLHAPPPPPPPPTNTPESPEPKTKVETWKNNARGGTTVLKFDRFGQERGERIVPGGTTSITPDERRLNHDRSSSAELDPFLNGRLSPVRLIDSEPDTEMLKVNPNSLSETEVRALFDMTPEELMVRLERVTNPIVLLEKALSVAEEVDARASQVKAVEARLDAVKEKPKRVRTAEDVAEDARRGRVLRPSDDLN